MQLGKQNIGVKFVMTTSKSIDTMQNSAIVYVIDVILCMS